MDRIDFPPGTSKAKLRTAIKDRTQPFVDVPVYEEVHALPTALAAQRSCIRTISDKPRVAYIRPVIRGPLLGWRRDRLCWMKPDGNGGLVPR